MVAVVTAIALGLMALTAVSVPIRGAEPSEGWTTLIGLTALVGLLVVGLLVALRSPQARLTGVVVMAFMPVVFFGGAVGALLAGMGWLGAAWQIQSRATMNSGPSSYRPPSISST